MSLIAEPLGVYISVPFCRAKCTFCNFASDTFAAGRMEAYAERVCEEIAGVGLKATGLGASLPGRVDSVYFGGGTPSLLAPMQLGAIFGRLREQFDVEPEAEITVECAPGQISDAVLAELVAQGMNRVSLGVQSFVDRESAAVGRLHTREMCLGEIERLRAGGVDNLSLDLIAGLPLQTGASWRYSVEEAIATGIQHVSVYMLEVDEESRLGREALIHGTRYGAGQLPTEEETVEFYRTACDLLGAAGVQQYEISNFAWPGRESRHNVKYWRRKPYAGFGLDAHSMLRTGRDAVRFANTDDLDGYVRGAGDPFAPARRPERVGREEAFEESLFLGLRMNAGLSLDVLRAEHGHALLDATLPALDALEEDGLVCMLGDMLQLTDTGRLLSNEVFSRILISAAVTLV